MKRVYGGIVGILLAASLQAEATGPCLNYEPEVVTLEGILARETHPGRPNYESIADGDEPETIWVLQLDEAICVTESDELSPAETGQTAVQLVLTATQYDQYRTLMGKRVRATGTLFHSHTGHHHKALLLTTAEIKVEHPEYPSP